MSKVTLGGDRLGSGNQQKVELHNYQMSSFNLEQDFKSTMAPGILYPFIKLIATNHGTFDIDLDSFIRTLPTQGPLFGSFKWQLDLFCCPFRLYQGILHNNPTSIGLNMNKVYLPKLLYTYGNTTQKQDEWARVQGSTDKDFQVAPNALIKYLGISGAGHKVQNLAGYKLTRKFNAVPILAYYDIFKTYYSNKQEENAYVITPKNIGRKTLELRVLTYLNLNDPSTGGYVRLDNQTYTASMRANESYEFDFVFYSNEREITEDIKNAIIEQCYISIDEGEGQNDYMISELISSGKINPLINFSIINNPDNTEQNPSTTIHAKVTFTANVDLEVQIEEQTINTKYYSSEIELTSFALKNIDKMRNKLLKFNELNEEFVIGEDWTTSDGEDATGYPYTALTKTTTNGISWNAFNLNGLVVKTYQSDLFNNWLDSEFIDTITAATKVNISNGSFSLDDLNLAEKRYDLYNRIIVSGNTYEDWQEARYGEGAIRKAETPMYMGGMSGEIMFEEVIASTEASEDQKLGSLAGKGLQATKNGGNNIHIRCEEPCYVIGIASITPRVAYSQGNDWDMTDLDSMEDLHAPALDGIGFQDLICEQMAWWDTQLKNDGTISLRHSAGKQTAWINYQTAVDKIYGDFAKGDGIGYMVLNRDYDIKNNSDLTPYLKDIKDLTTYIDPKKYNYAFAVDDLFAQNFWVQIHSRVIARRKMGAQQIPNL